jgi:lipopolysaccharide/colanic/teichoic acid biosynthesis glycosyltransferase
MRRTVDIAFAIISLILALPLLILIAILVKVFSRGTVFFVQERVGLHEQPFRLYKFRTMILSETGLQITVGDDRRITRIGRILRRLRLDELPQLLNVLRGDMTVIGPRPEVPAYVAKYQSWMREVLEFKPGLTDSASLKFRDEGRLLETAEDPEQYYIDEIAPSKIRISLDYQRRRNPLTDLIVVIRTVTVVLGL